MRLLKLIILLLFPLTLFAQSVKVTKEKGIDYSSYKTFSLVKGELVTVSTTPVDTASFHKRTVDAIKREMSDKGYQYTEEPSTGDLIIGYVAEAITKIEVQDVGPLGQEPVNDPSQVNPSRSWSREYGEGSLVIDITDARTKKSVWRATSTVDASSISDERLINALVFRSLKKFPRNKK